MLPKFLQRTQLIATTRSLVLLLCAAFLLADPVLGQSDVVASTVAFSIISMIALLLLTATVFALNTKKKILLELISPHSTGVIDAQEELTFILKVTQGRVFPLFRLTIETTWTNEDLNVPTQIISAHKEEVLIIPMTLKFPHRGVWTVKSFLVTASDIFGMGSYQWEIPAAKISFIVRPPLGEQSHLPVISSRQREGDDAIDIHNRRGEPFDLKTYHPSDGIKKIVWKLYAKSGELVARHPEPAMTPEGEVILFIFATRDDDAVCSAALDYLKHLTTLGLEIRVGCLGMETRLPAQTPLTAEKLLIDTVWSASVADERRDLDYFVAQCGNISATTNVLLFFSKAHLRSEVLTTKLLELGNNLTRQHIAPIFLPTAAAAESTADSDPRASRSAVLGWLMDGVAPAPSTGATQTEFFSRCFSQQWQVVEP